MNYIKEPMEIEKKSMQIIKPYLDKLFLTEDEIAVCSRMIHASGDVDYANHVKLSENAVNKAAAALEAGANIFCDVEMVRTGINKKRLGDFGGQVHCLIADKNVARQAREQSITRSMMAIRTFGEKLNGAIVAIGNAPTALFELLTLMEKDNILPACIIGVPVGFVGAAESKEELVKRSKVPYITVLGNKGGSSIAAAAVNALLYRNGR